MREWRKTLRRKAEDLAYRTLMVCALGLVGITTRKTWINRHILEAFQEQGQNFLIGIWHNNLVYFIYLVGGMKLTTLVSRSRDGENVVRIAACFGQRLVRGSTSDRGFGGLREMFRVLKSGRSATIMPDGPRGPRYVLQQGIVSLAQRTGVPIIPAAFSGPDLIEFGSWDRAKLPRPFSKVAIYFGNPIWIDRDEKDEDAIRLRVERAMREAVVHVDRFVGGKLVEREPLLAEAAEPEGS